MPPGADTVFMQEDVRADGDSRDRAAGTQARRQSPACRRGRARRARSCCRPAAGSPPQDVALAAALGLTALEVRRRVRVALFSTGDEIVEPGDAAAGRGALRRQPLSARRAARAPRRRRDRSRHPARRSRARLRAPSRRRRATHDLVLTSGGVSTGEADHVRSAVETVGRLVFWRVAIKPGRPVAMGVIRGIKPARARRSSACRAIRSRSSSPSRAWCGRCCCGSPAPRRSR